VASNVLHNTGGGLLLCGAVAGTIPYVVLVGVLATSGAKYQIIFNYTSSSSYSMVEIDFGSPTTVSIKGPGGTILTSANYTITLGGWYAVQVCVESNVTQANIGGYYAVSTAVSNTSTSVALGSAGGTTQFKQFAIAKHASTLASCYACAVPCPTCLNGVATPNLTLTMASVTCTAGSCDPFGQYPKACSLGGTTPYILSANPSSILTCNWWEGYCAWSYQIPGAVAGQIQEIWAYVLPPGFSGTYGSLWVTFQYKCYNGSIWQCEALWYIYSFPSANPDCLDLNITVPRVNAPTTYCNWPATVQITT
jgi:hypothetical protein